jgi:oligogalacturonide lyase
LPRDHPGVNPARHLLLSTGLLLGLGSAHAAGANFGRHYPSEKTSYVDPVTKLTVTILTTDKADDAKPYQTHTTWTSDGKWIIFRASRGGNGPQIFLLNEQSGDIVQVTDTPGTGTGSLNLSRKEMKLYYMRGGAQGFGRGGGAGSAPAAPRQLIETNIGTLLADSLAGHVKDAATYERVVATLPADLRDGGGFALDADESKAYWGVATGPQGNPANRAGGAGRAAAAPVPAIPTAATTTGAGGRMMGRAIDQPNMDPNYPREANRTRWELQGRGTGGIRSIDLKTGEIKTVVDVNFRMGHVQTNPWVPGEIVYCHETTGDAPQRMWFVRGDGTDNRPLYKEDPEGWEWITHETFATKDEVMFLIMGHLPYLRERPTGVAVVNLRTNRMNIIGQIDEAIAADRPGGFWHCNGSSDGRWAVADTFKGDIYVIDRHTGERTLLTTDHKMTPDHAHPIFSPDNKRVVIQSGRLTDGVSLDLMSVTLPDELLKRRY